jgi:hypothetical protein
LAIEDGYAVGSRSSPQRERDWNRIDVEGGPPRGLVAVTMEFAVMAATDRHCVFIADFSAMRARLGEAKMMRVGRGATADDAGLCSHEFAVLLVA